jgi:hypothetical protein
VVAPDLIASTDLDAALEQVVRRVADERGTIVGYVAVGPSAASFPSLSLSVDANFGVFAVGGHDESERKKRSRGLEGRVSGEIAAQIGSQPMSADGLDLLGGLRQCARKLAMEHGERRIALISHGVHRTVDLDLVDHPELAVARLPGEVLAAIGDPIAFEMHAIGRVDDALIGGPPARKIIEPVVEAWTEVCVQLGRRCHNFTSTKETS